MSETPENTLIAYDIERPEDCQRWTIRPASAKREWMNANNGHAYRCLPLTVANHMGWVIEWPVTVRATWNGETSASHEIAKEAVNFEFDCDGDQAEYFGRHIVSDFGNGIVSIAFPWLFRTPSIDGLVVRGAPNFWVDGATPLDGFVETNWLPFTFTMNWKLHRPNQTVIFEKGTPITFLHPFNIETLKNYTAEFRPIASDPELNEAYKKWYFVRQVTRTSDIGDKLPEMNNRYKRGKDYDGNRAGEHNRALNLRPFSHPDENNS